MDKPETDRLTEALSPLVLQQLSDFMDRVAASMDDASDCPGKVERDLHGLYVMGAEHFKANVRNRLQTLLLERKFKEAAAAFSEPIHPLSHPCNGSQHIPNSFRQPIYCNSE